MNSGRRAIFASIASIAASGLLLKKRWIQSLMVDSVEAASDLKTELRGTIDTAIALAQNELTLTVPAASMRSQADAFRARFVHDYLDPKNKFPIFQAMFLAQILPTNIDATHKMGATAAGPRFLTISGENPGVRNLFNDDSIPDFDARFAADLNGQSLAFTITFPRRLQATAIYDSKGMAFALTSRIALKLENKIVFNGHELPVPQKMIVTRVSVSATSLEYDLLEDGGQGSKITIILDFSAEPRNVANSRTGGLRAVSRILGALSLVVLMFGACITNNGHSSSPPFICLDNKVKAQNQLEHIVKCYNDSSIHDGIIKTGGKSFIRDGSFVGAGNCPTPPPPPPPTPPTLNEFSFARFDEVGIGCTLEICANVDPPPGWISLEPFPDDKGCDVEPGTAANFNNVKLIQRQH
jgi:hypothetical protein